MGKIKAKPDENLLEQYINEKPKDRAVTRLLEAKAKEKKAAIKEYRKKK